jgi:hypothetical protein
MISSCLTTYNKLFPYRANISNDIQNKCMYDNDIDCVMGRRGHIESDRPWVRHLVGSNQRLYN